MDLKFKDYLCLIVPILTVVLLYTFGVSGYCILLGLSDFMIIGIMMPLTIILLYPGLKLMFKYFDWYDNRKESE